MTNGVETNVKAPMQNKLAGATLAVGILAAVAALAFLRWMAEEVFEGESMALDHAVREFIHGYASNPMTAAMQSFSFMGSTLFLFPVVILIVAFCLFTQRYRPALILTTVMTGASILNFVLKVYFQRDRPESYFDTPLPASFSFPSGHALLSVCFYCTLAWLVSSSLERRPLRYAVWAACITIALLIGISRIYLGVHYPTDVLAGFLAAFIWLMMAACADLIVGKTKGPSHL